MNWWLFLIPLFSALLGWIINRILVKMLFYPRIPVKVLGITFQGVFPKKQPQLAQQLGKLVSTELFSFKDVEAKITSPDNLKKVMPLAEEHIDHFLHTKLAEVFPMISMFIGEKTINQLKTVFMQELEQIFPALMQQYMKNLQQDLDLEQMVVQKIRSFPPDKLETVLKQVMAKELRFVEITGGIVGFTIGLIQVVITVLVS